jgi:hypothetical protein
MGMGGTGRVARAAATALLLTVAAWPLRAAAAPAVCDAEDRVTIDRPEPGTVQLRLVNPCRAGTLVYFDHDGASLVELADGQGTVALLRRLAPGVNRIRLVDEGEAPRDLLVETVPIAAPPDRETAGGRASGEECPATEVAATTEPGGLARLVVTNRCAAGAAIRVAYLEQGLSFRGRLDAAGRAELAVSLVDPAAGFEVAVEGRDIRTLTIPFPDHRTVTKVLLVWDDPVDLDLHVLEPDARLGGNAGDIHASTTNRDGRRGRGRLERSDDGTAAGSKVEAYVLEEARRPAGRSLGLYVSDVSRGRLTHGEHCGAGRHAGIPYRVLTLETGQLKLRRYSLGPLACGRDLDDAAFFVPIGELRLR